MLEDPIKCREALLIALFSHYKHEVYSEYRMTSWDVCFCFSTTIMFKTMFCCIFCYWWFFFLLLLLKMFTQVENSSNRFLPRFTNCCFSCILQMHTHTHTHSFWEDLSAVIVTVTGVSLLTASAYIFNNKAIVLSKLNSYQSKD